MNEGMGNRKGKTGKYKLHTYSFDPAYWERVQNFHILTQSILGVQMRQMDFFTVMLLCTEKVLLNPTYKAVLERKETMIPSQQTLIRLKLFSDLLEKHLKSVADDNPTPIPLAQTSAQRKMILTQLFGKFLESDELKTALTEEKT